MQGAHRRIVAAIVGIAAVLGVVAISRTAALGPDGPSSEPVAATVATTTVQPGTDPAAAAAELERARADLKKAIAERDAARTTPARTVVRVPAAAPASASGGSSYDDDDHEYDDDDHGYEDEHEEDD